MGGVSRPIYSPDCSVVEFFQNAPPGIKQFSFGSVDFGSSGHKQRPAGFVLENYRHRKKSPGEVKSVVNPRRAAILLSVHKYQVLGRSADENYGRIVSERNLILPADKMRINHYKFKSLEESRAKALRGSALRGGGISGGSWVRYTDEYIAKNDVNDVFDYSAEKWVKKLKES